MAIFHLLVALSACAASAYGNAVGPRDPTITPAPILERQVSNPRFVGYYSDITDYSTETGQCIIGMTWTASGNYGRCCSTALGCGHNDFGTACLGVSVMYPDGPYSCTDFCNTNYIYQNPLDSNPTKWIGCNEIVDQTSFYRATSGSSPAKTTGASSSSKSASSASGASSAAPTIRPITTTKYKKASMLWIIGPIAGGVVFIAVVAIIICCVVTKKKKRARANAAAAGANTGFRPQPAPQGQQQYMPIGQAGAIPMQQQQQQQYVPPQSPYGQGYAASKSPDFTTAGTPPPQQWTPVPLAAPPPATSPALGVPPMNPGAVHDQRLGDSRSPVHSLSEMGSNAQQSPATTHTGPVSELSSPNIHRPTPVSYQSGPVQASYHPTVSEMPN